MPRPSPLLRRLTLSLALLVAAAGGLGAQSTTSGCDYTRCAYSIVAVPSGLRVTRGADETPVATLGFLFTRDISVHFNEAARTEARAAVRTRRWAALLTDTGLATTLAGLVLMSGSETSNAGPPLVVAGLGLVGISVPLQFRADTRLARAIWRHNAVYAAGTR